MGFSDVLPTSKGENWTFRPHPPPIPLNVVPFFELPEGNKKTPNFEWKGGTGVWIILFSEGGLF